MGRLGSCENCLAELLRAEADMEKAIEFTMPGERITAPTISTTTCVRKDSAPLVADPVQKVSMGGREAERPAR